MAATEKKVRVGRVWRQGVIKQEYVCRYRVASGETTEKEFPDRAAAVAFARDVGNKKGGSACVFPKGGRPFDPLRDAGPEEDE